MNTLEQNITEFGLLAEMAYLNLQDNIGSKINEFVNKKNGAKRTLSKEYKIVDYVSTASDFQALLLQDESGKFVMAFRGTTSTLDWLNNAGIGFKNINEQYNDAKEFLEKAMKDYGVTIDNLTLTGHSLGGILTQQVGATYGIKGYAFNPYGTDRLLSLPESPFDGIVKNSLYGLLTSLAEKVMSAVGLTKANAQWAYEHIYNISYQDEGAINGDILSNLLTELSSNHLGHFIPIMGKNLELSNGMVDTIIKGHGMEALNTAIAEYNEIVKKFDNSCRYEDITQMYLSTAIIHGSGYKKVRDEFKKLGILNENGANDKIANNSLHLEVIAKDTDATSIFSGSNLSTPALYALVNLNPFIVSNINSNAYSELERYKDDFTKGYIEDKAKMFKAALTSSRTLDNKYYQDNISGIKIKPMFDNTGIVSSGDIKEQYYFGSNERDIITINSNGVSSNAENKIYTLAGDDTIIASKGNNYIEAGSGNDTIDLSRTSKNSKNIVYADIKGSKHSDNKNNNNDTIIGGAGTDTIYGGSGFDTYRVGNGDTIYDDKDGEGTVFFNNIELTGGTYDKDKACYVGGIYEYHLNGNTLIVTDTAKNESITINNYSKKDKSLGIDLIEADEIDIIISNATVTEGDESEPNKDGKAPYNTSIGIKLSRELKEDEFIIIQKYNYEKQSTELVLFGTLPQDYDTSLFKSLLSDNKTLDFSWYGNKTKEEDRKYCVGGVNIFAKSDNLIIRDIKPGYVTIKDDDKDPNDDKPETYDPLAIDLNNDGIKGTNLDYKINFDLDNNGFKEATSWIDNNDAFIAIDKNNNGAIDNGSELFGNKSISNNAYAYTNPNAKNGFESLKELDSNNDDIIDEKDKEFENLLLWQDKNSDGISQENEIIKLSEKVKSINLSYTKNGQTEISSATLNDNTEVKVQDMYFNVDLKKTEEIIDENQIPFEIKSLPNVKAFGNLKEFANLNLLVA